MKLCIPVEADKGLESAVYGHFGSAPLFLVVETDTLAVTPLTNSNQHHAHGMCQPVAALGGAAVDGVVVGGIGRGALMKLNAAGIAVYHSPYATVAQTVEAMKTDKLPVFRAENTCAGHSEGGGCSH
jgi:predicted Fe-Mo cluster-binding NifX family protein